MTNTERLVGLTENVVAIKVGVEKLEGGQKDLKLQFTNHLEHHREDRIKTEDRFRRWVWISIPTIATLILALVSAAYFIGRS